MTARGATCTVVFLFRCVPVGPSPNATFHVWMGFRSQMVEHSSCTGKQFNHERPKLLSLNTTSETWSIPPFVVVARSVRVRQVHIEKHIS